MAMIVKTLHRNMALKFSQSLRTMVQMAQATLRAVKSAIQIIIICSTGSRRVSWTRACGATLKVRATSHIRNRRKTWTFLAISVIGGASILLTIRGCSEALASAIRRTGMEIGIRMLVIGGMAAPITPHRQPSMMGRRPVPLAKVARATPCISWT